MRLLLAALGMAGTALLGAAAFAILHRPAGGATPGSRALWAGASYPLGALLVAAWMIALAVLGVRASTPLALAPVVAVAALAVWRLARRRPAWRPLVDALAGRALAPRERALWIALVAWLALRLLLLGLEATSRPPLPWEAWLHAAARAHVWYALREPGAFVSEPVWWSQGGYLAGLPGGSRLTPALDAWTTFSVGGFDDTLIHAPWLAFWASLVLLAYGALRHAGAVPVAALFGAAFVATLPLPSAHAALGGTAALPLASHLAGAYVFAWRWSTSRRTADALIAMLMVAGMLVAGGGAALVWTLTLLPFAAGRLPLPLMRKAFAAAIAVAIVVTILVAQNRLFAPAALEAVPGPGLAALAQHALLLGNWHVLPYAAIAAAALGWRAWQQVELLPATVSTALGVVALAAFTSSAAGRALVGSTGTIGVAATAWAPTLALWTALVAQAWYARSTAASQPAVASEPSIEPGAPSSAVTANEASR